MSLLGTEEISYYDVDDKLIDDRSLLPSNCSSPESYKLTVVNPKPYINQNQSSDRGFLKGPAVFLVTDNLVVRPKSRIFLLHVLKSSNVPLTDIEYQTVHVGTKEELCLLVASFVGESALSNVFLRNRGVPKQEQ
ncbi:hypothetical protein ACFX15_028778 [Malus domestica]